MAKLSLQLKLGQQLAMTPQLQQAIRLLQMPVMELNTQILQALETNVMLEQEEPPAAETPEPTSEESTAEVLEGEAFDTSNWDDTGPSDSIAGNDFQPEYADHSGESLKEHLLWQIDIEDFSPREVVIAQALVDCINDDGYLTDSLENIGRALPREPGFTAAEIEGALSKLHELDPVGVGARDLSECVRLQLQQLDPTEPGVTLALRIAASSLERVADNELAMLRRELGVSEADLDDALTLIRACHPKPGSAVSQDTAEYVIPDVYVRKQDNRWIVDINRSSSPKLSINQTYAGALDNSEGYSTLRSQLQEARFLIRSLEIRNETLTKVAMCIVERQVEFLENGETAMKPMILRDVAEAVDMHESTISRVTTNKYMHTPRGVFEFKYFFSSQLTAIDGSGESSTALRARIKRLIGEEAPDKPLSDSKLAKLLAADGSNIARRTIAKYREALNIPSSSERKKRSMH
jgi:RNA polymerase sigma-54 factor